MIDLAFSFTGTIWQWKGGAWHFITLPIHISDDIKAFTRHHKTAFGSVRVKVRIHHTEWMTSLFPDKKSGCYLLPIKTAIRKTEKLSDGSECQITLNILI